MQQLATLRLGFQVCGCFKPRLAMSTTWRVLLAKVAASLLPFMFHVLSSCQRWVGVLEKVEVKGVVKGWIMLVGKESLSTDPGMVGCRSAK